MSDFASDIDTTLVTSNKLSVQFPQSVGIRRVVACDSIKTKATSSWVISKLVAIT